MGQAKKRGTFEERKAQAIAKLKKPIPHEIRPRGKSRAGLLVAAALAASSFN